MITVILALLKAYAGLPELETAVPKLPLPPNFTAAISDWADLPFVDVQLGYEFGCNEGYEFMFNRYWNGTKQAYYCEAEHTLYHTYEDCPQVPLTIDAEAPQNQTLFHLD